MVVRYIDPQTGKRLGAVDGQITLPSAIAFADVRDNQTNVRHMRINTGGVTRHGERKVPDRRKQLDRSLCATQVPRRTYVDCWPCLMMGFEVSIVAIENVELRPLTRTVFRCWRPLPEVCY